MQSINALNKVIMQFLYVVSFLLLIHTSSICKDKINLIPKPRYLKEYTGSFFVTEKTKIYYTKGIETSAKLLSRYIGISNSNLEKIKNSKVGKRANSIAFIISDKLRPLGKEGYSLIIKPNQIILSSSDAVGISHGIQTIRQLLPPEIENKNKPEKFNYLLPCLEIKDSPSFPWRGLMLDCGRHFMSKKFIIRYIDLLALYKINVFHWHLTEDQGWRIEIKKYPKLTEVGAWRYNPDVTMYGGYYTQNDIKEIVSYATERNITIVPEIELPGHCTAAIASYPELSCTGKKIHVETQWGVFNDVFCAGNEMTFKFLEDVLSEVADLFPWKYIHIGGDEVPKSRWKECPKCQARIKAEGLKNEEELQSYFVKRISKFLAGKGKQVIGWDENLEGGLAPGTVVQVWRDLKYGIETARQNHFVIMSPSSFTYINSDYQALDMRKIYFFNPVPDKLDKYLEKYILGSEANLWSEYAPEDSVDIKVFPRLMALSEILWSGNSNKDYKDFCNRVFANYQRLNILGVKHGPAARPITINSEYDHKENKVFVILEPDDPNLDIYYSIDGTEPTVNSYKYNGKVEIRKTSILRARTFRNNNAESNVVEKYIPVHLAMGKEIKSLSECSTNYPGGGKYGLVDGILGTEVYSDGYWQGYHGNDLEAVVDLGEDKQVKEISSNYLQCTPVFIFLPRSVEYYYSMDGKDYKLIKKIFFTDDRNEKPFIKTYTANTSVSARYIKVKAVNIGVCPYWHIGKGDKAWVFVDEIIVR